MSRHVLLVADDAAIAAPLMGWLSELGYAVTPADGAAEVVDLFAGHVFSLVVFHLEPGHMTALGTIARLREMAGGSPTPTIAVTSARGSQLERLKSFARMLGVTAWLHTPLERDRLVARVEEAMQPRTRSSEEAAAAAWETARKAARAQMRRAEKKAAPAPPAEAAPGESTEDQLVRLRFELYELRHQPARDRLGLPAEAGREQAREAYFDLVAAYHAENAKAKSDGARTAIVDIQATLKEAYFAIRRGTKLAVAEDPPQPPPPVNTLPSPPPPKSGAPASRGHRGQTA